MDPLVVRVLHADATVIDGRWRFALRNPFWRIYCNDDAGAEVSFPDGVLQLAPDRIHVLPAWGDFASRCRRSVGHAYLHVDPGEPLRDLPARHDAAGRALARPWTLPRDPLLVARFRAVCSERRDTVWWRLRAQAVALTILAAVLDQVPASVRTILEEGVEDDVLAPVRRWIDHVLPAPIPVARLAREAGLSPSHFAKIFRARTGVAPRRYVQERRIALAAERLIASDDPIEQVAADFGFANRFHFSRVFASRMGQGPAAYRRAGRSSRS